MSQSPTSVVPVRGRQPSGGSSRGGARRALEARRAPVIATAPGSGDRDLKRWVVAASLATASNSDISRLTMSRGRYSNLLAKHRPRASIGHGAVACCLGRPGVGLGPAEERYPHRPTNQTTRTPILCRVSQPMWSPRAPNRAVGRAASRKAPTDRTGRALSDSRWRGVRISRGPAAEISPAARRSPGNPGPVGDLPRRSVERTGDGGSMSY